MLWKVSNISYEVLEQQIRALPDEAQLAIAHYVSYLYSIYNSISEKKETAEKINTFLKKNPSAFAEFNYVENVGLESIRELTKNDTW